LLLAPNKLSHIERIDVVTVNPERMSFHSLFLEAKLFVEPDSSLVVVITINSKRCNLFVGRDAAEGAARHLLD
jgi:hypothetical protein